METKPHKFRTSRMLLALCLPLGLLFFFITRIAGERMSDFMNGFCSGVSVVLMLIGIAYCGWCLGKRVNPFDFNH